ncbi:MAG: hypothetical protein OK456_09710 [Thaumarchaeota archaeon]|nr:hypothetical protein [Nitrososphaerota archaeon]
MIVLVIVAVAIIAYSVYAGQPGSAAPSSIATSDSTSEVSTQGTATSLVATSTASGTGSDLTTTLTSGNSSVGVTESTVAGPIKHVIIIVMENEPYGNVIGNPSAPYENSLASQYAIASDYFAVSHPSLPNYLALVAGSTFGVTTDCLPNQCSVPGPTIASLLDSHGLSWREYAESMPANCSQTDSSDGLYVARHDPFVYFSSITNNTGSGITSVYCDSHAVSFSQFWTDLQASNLPNYSIITPNICDDAHSCPLSTGDAWLSTVIPRIVNSSSFASTAVFVVYDEGSGSAPNTTSQVTCILVSPFAKDGFVSSAYYTHYSLLATVEAIFGLGSLGRNDANATVMSDMLTIGI